MIGETQLYHREKEPVVAKLSLISLMDIFTILVFFLLLNSGETQNIETAKFVTLPDSISGTSLHDELTIFVGEESLKFGDDQIFSVSELFKDLSKPIEPLALALEANTLALGELNDFQEKTGLSITIMADKGVSYEVLKTVMETCRDKNYRNISLAVNKIEGTPFTAGEIAVPSAVVPQSGG